VLSAVGKNSDTIVWIVDIGFHGTLYGVRVKDGKLLAKGSLHGTGRPLTTPLIYGHYLYMPSTMPDTNESILEGFKIEMEG